MKKLLLSLLLLLQLGRLSAQIELVINGSNMAIMDTDNKLSIVNSNYTFKQVILMAKDSNQCMISKRDDQWYLYPAYNHLSYKCEIELVHKKKVRSTFQVECVSQLKPIVAFNHLHPRSGMKKNDLQDADSLIIASEFSINVLRNYYVSRFRVIYMPVNGNMEEYSINSNQLGSDFKSIIRKSKAGDLLVFDGIRMKSRRNSNYERALNTFVIKVTPEEKEFNSGVKITGYVRDGINLKPFIYPKGLENEFPKMEQRDSLWHTYIFDPNTQEFLIDFTEVFEKGIMKEKTFYKNGLKLYSIRSLTDSTSHCKIFYPNGNLKHEGDLKINTNFSIHRKFYIQPVHSDTLKPYNSVLFDSPDDYYPIGFWISIFPEKQLKVTTVWKTILDETFFEREHIDEEEYLPNSFYLKLIQYTTSDLNNKNIITFEMK
ncbi:MAG TPA: hypothetical protein VGF79_14205 [Bacteroidia bacterium]